MTRTGICLLFLSALSLGGCSRSLDTQQMVRSLDDLRAEVRQLNERLRDLDEREQNASGRASDLLAEVKQLNEWLRDLDKRKQNASDKKSELLSAAAAAYRTKFECVAANLANAETVGYKRFQVRFVKAPEGNGGGGESLTMPVPPSLCVGAADVRTVFTQGPFQQTGNQLDLAIEGDGFFAAKDPAGAGRLYTRSGNLGINANNQLVLGSASNVKLLDPSVTIPSDATAIVVSTDGQVLIQQPGSPELSTIGTIQLFTFINPVGLENLQDGFFRETEASGTAQLRTPGTGGAGLIRQGALEASNVEIRTELLDAVRTVGRLQTIESNLVR